MGKQLSGNFSVDPRTFLSTNKPYKMFFLQMEEPWTDKMDNYQQAILYKSIQEFAKALGMGKQGTQWEAYWATDPGWSRGYLYIQAGRLVTDVHVVYAERDINIDNPLDTPSEDFHGHTSDTLTSLTLSDSTANWVINELTDMYLQPNINNVAQYKIVSNTATTITVLGGSDLRTHASVGDRYAIMSTIPAVIRTDEVILDLWLQEVGADEDTDLNVDIRGSTYEPYKAMELKAFTFIRQGITTTNFEYTDAAGNNHFLIKLAHLEWSGNPLLPPFITIDIPTYGDPTGPAAEGVNVGSGVGVFKQKFGNTLRFRSLTSDLPVTVTEDGNEILLGVDVPSFRQTAGLFEGVGIPGAAFDSVAGYSVHDRYLNTTLGREWVCKSNTPAAAVWYETTVGSSGRGTNVSMTVYVDPINGNNSTGVVGDLLHPYATLQAAITALEAVVGAGKGLVVLQAAQYSEVSLVISKNVKIVSTNAILYGITINMIAPVEVIFDQIFIRNITFVGSGTVYFMPGVNYSNTLLTVSTSLAAFYLEGCYFEATANCSFPTPIRSRNAVIKGASFLIGGITGIYYDYTRGVLTNSSAPSISSDLVTFLYLTSGFIPRVPSAVLNNIVLQNADGSLKDGGYSLDDIQDASFITTGVFDEDRIPNLSASKITSDNLDVARMPLSGVWSMTGDLEIGPKLLGIYASDQIIVGWADRVVDLITFGYVDSRGGFRVNTNVGQNATLTILTAIQKDGVKYEYKSRSLVFTEGIITTVGDESDWIEVPEV